jgi:uncharacterized delta-60 repeat protein
MKTLSFLKARHLHLAACLLSAFTLFLATDTSAQEIRVFAGLTEMEDSLGSLNYGNVSTLHPEAGHPFNIVIQNAGASALTVPANGITVDGPHFDDFNDFLAGVTTPFTVPAGGSTTLTLGFKPSAAGLREAVMHITSNDADESPFDITLLGTAQAPSPVGGVPYAWGKNSNGHCGVGAANYQSSFNAPQGVLTSGALNGKSVTAVSAGVDHSLALTADGKVFGWGFAGYGQLGRTSGGSYTEEAVASDASAILNEKTVTAIVAGYWHSLALTSDGLIFAFGLNGSGQLGIGTNTNTNTPTQVVTDSPGLQGESVVAIVAGWAHSMALTADGEVYAWGQNGVGELGTGDTTGSNVPVNAAVAANRIVKIHIGGSQSFALTTDGRLYAWGYNNWGQIGDGTTTNRTLPVLLGTTGDMAGKTITNMGAGNLHSFATDSDGRLYAWGYNGYGALGTGDTTQRLNPTLIGGTLATKQVTRIRAGLYHSLATTADNKVFAWGDNSSGQLGGATAYGAGTSSPTELDLTSILVGGKVVTDLAAGRYYHALMLVGEPLAPEIEVRESYNEALVTLGQVFDLGAFVVGETDWVPYKVFNIKNAGTSPLTITSTTITGFAASDFTRTLPYPATLPPGESTHIWVEFHPSALGTRNATLHIASNDSDEGDFNVSLTGAGYHESAAERLDTFHPNVAGGVVNDMAVLPDGKIIIVGSFTSVGGLPRSRIARLNADGTVDDTTSWHTPGTNGPVETVAVQPDGKIIIGGQFTQASYYGGFYTLYLTNLARLHSNGDVDVSWYPATDGTVQTLFIEPTNKLLIGGTFSTVNAAAIPKIARIDLADAGYVYPGFVPSPNGNVRKLLRDSNGRILVAGTFSSIAGTTMNGVARLLDTGAIDPTWVNPQCDNNVNMIAIQPSDGKILIGGQFGHVGGQTAYHLARLNLDGSVDSYFLAHCNGTIHDISIASDGKIVAAGSFDYIWSPGFMQWTPQARIARFHAADGYPDFSFPIQAYADQVRTVDFQSDGALLFGGAFTQVNLSLRNNFARMTVKDPDIHVLSTGAIIHEDGDTRDFGSVLVGGGYSTVIFTLQNVGAVPLTGFSGAAGITIDGTNAAAFSLSGTGATSLAIGASTPIIIYFNPQGPGAHEAWLRIHSNDPDEEPFDIKLVGTGGVPITTWRQQNFGTTSNTGNAADDADPDHDGVPNLLEFATGGAPGASDAMQDTLEPPASGFVEFHYTRNKLAMAEITFQVQWAEDLLSAWQSSGVTESVTSDNGALQEVTARVPAGNLGHRFVRLNVTRQ